MSGKGRERKESSRSALVYSTEAGRLCRNCGQPRSRCRCRARPTATAAPTDGKVRVRREVKGRRGKTVTTISGVPLANEGLRELAREFKRLCGTGGAVKNGVVEIQGDHCEKLLAALIERGYPAIRAGG
jgi:translation initiation factor 1